MPETFGKLTEKQKGLRAADRIRGDKMAERYKIIDSGDPETDRKFYPGFPFTMTVAQFKAANKERKAAERQAEKDDMTPRENLERAGDL